MLKILKTFYRFLAKKRAWFGFYILTAIASGVLYSITPYFYKLFVDEIQNFNFNRLLWVLLAYVGVRFLAMFVEGLAYTVGDYILIRASSNARSSIFKYLQNLDFAFHTEKSTGSLISAIKRGDGAFFNLFHSIHFKILEVLVGFIVMIYFFTKIDPVIAGISVAFFVAIVGITKFIITYNIDARTIYNKEEDHISAIIVDNLINYETVKLFSKENWELNRLKQAFEPWKKALWNYGMSFRLFDVSIGTLINLSVFFTILFALRLTSENKFSLGDFVLVMGFINAFYPRVWELVWGFRQIAKHYVDIKRYFGILDERIQVKDPKKPMALESVDGEIEFKEVNFSYKGGKKDALKHFNLKIRQGQSVALVGKSGSGKTTVVKLLMRFFDVDRGQITIDNINIRDFTKSHLRSFIGVVPQEPILFNNTIAYNIGYAKQGSTREEVEAAAKMANLDRFIASLPHGYQTHVGERGIKLSGGQKQRLAIARMILADPEIIIFDEATSQLDSESERLIQDALWKVAKNKTTIIIAHRLSTVMRADKIIVVKNGKIIETGSHQALINKKDSLYKRFWDLQVKLE